MRVKICGITNYEDAMCAIKYGADALGFVFYKKSPRYISPTHAKEIIDKLPPFVERVGLFVNEDSGYINKICLENNISLAQIHFEVDSEFLNQLNIKYLPVIRAKSKDDIVKNQNRYCLIDAFVDGYGGSGKRVEAEWFDGVDVSKMILAGGLNSDNLGFLKKFNFYGIDVSSGVEKHKGKKDCNKIMQFMQNARMV
jgi:phosphoribosylanthranilate isomerase